MKRIDLMKAITDLKDSDNIQESISELESFAKEFIDHFEGEFESIEQGLDSITDPSDKVETAKATAEKCANALF